MTDYVPEKTNWVADQLAQLDRTGTTQGILVMDRPIVVFTIRGRKSGKLRRVPLMRVEHDGEYAMVASKGGAPEHPTWYASVLADPQVQVQDGTATHAGRARPVSGEEREQWWARAVAAYPPYADYQQKTDREIPVLVVGPLT